MSKRRKIGDRVWLAPHSGFTGESAHFEVEIASTVVDENGLPDGYCCLDCGDPECREWPDVKIVRDLKWREELIGRFLYHISECEMHDEPQIKGGAA